MGPQQEPLRHQYLHALGITSWLPRTPLPGAAPSAAWVDRFCWPEVEEPLEEAFEAPDPEESVAATVTAQRAPRAAAHAGAEAARAALGQTESPAPAPPPAEAPLQPRAVAARSDIEEGAAEVAEPIPRVKLAFVVAGDLLIVDSLPPAGRQGFGPAHQRLLQGIVRALGVSEAPSDAALLPWPQFAGTTLNQGPRELGVAVRRKLQYTLELCRIRRALLLGQSAARWLSGRDEPLSALRGAPFELEPDLPCVASASLTEALRLPEVKAEIWRDIQPLLPRP